MAITFQHKIILRPGSVFCFGTISSVADEEKTFLDTLRESRSEAGKSATPSAPSKDYLLQARSRGSVYSENPAVHLLYGKMDADHKEKGNKRGEGSSGCSSSTSALKGEQNEACRYDDSILPRRPLHRGKSGIDPRL
jgi:hypothetical protein